MADSLRDAMRTDAVAAPTLDRTIVATAARDELEAPRFDPIILDSIERRLARHVGPIAKRLVQSAIRRADTVEGLCEALSRSIEEPTQRSQFLNETMGIVRTQMGATTARTTTAAPGSNPAIPEDEVEGVQRDFARFMGPIAKVLIKRALGSVSSAQELREKLAAHIDNPRDRAKFLKGN
jgi:eukaryotic-like serine/threonine-protein kinase